MKKDPVPILVPRRDIFQALKIPWPIKLDLPRNVQRRCIESELRPVKEVFFFFFIAAFIINLVDLFGSRNFFHFPTSCIILSPIYFNRFNSSNVTFAIIDKFLSNISDWIEYFHSYNRFPIELLWYTLLSIE